MPCTLSTLSKEHREIKEQLEKVRKCRADLEGARRTVQRAIDQLEAAKADDVFSVLGDKVFRPGNDGRRGRAIKTFESAKSSIDECLQTLSSIRDLTDDLVGICEIFEAYLSLVKKHTSLLPSIQVARELNLNLGGIGHLSTAFLAVSGLVGAGILLGAMGGYLSVFGGVSGVAAAVLAAVLLIGGIVAGEVRMEAFVKAEEEATECLRKVKELKTKLDEVEAALKGTFRSIGDKLSDANCLAGGRSNSDIKKAMNSVWMRASNTASRLEQYEELLQEGPPEKALRIASMGFQGLPQELLQSLLLIMHAVSQQERADVEKALRVLQQRNVNLSPEAIATAKLTYAQLHDATFHDEASA